VLLQDIAQQIINAPKEGLDLFIRDLIKKFAELKCKEQRILCFENMEYDTVSRYDVDKLSIINAQEPPLS